MNRFEQEMAELDRLKGMHIQDLPDGRQTWVWSVTQPCQFCGFDLSSLPPEANIYQHKYGGCLTPEKLRILPADEPKEERDFFGVVYCALATIGAMAIFYWGARAIQFLVRWAR